MGNPSSSGARVIRLAAAILVMTGGVAIDTSWGASWSEVNAGLSSADVEVSAVVISPAAPSTLYVRGNSANGFGGIFRTTDGAANWKAISSVVGANSVTVDPKNPSTVYAVTGRGLLKSTNGGGNWSGAGAGLPSDSFVSMLAIDPVTTSTLYAATGAGIFKSTNGGGSWNVLNTGLSGNGFASSLVIDPVTPSRIYFTGSVFQNGGPSIQVILKSADGGQSWNTLDTGLPPDASIRSLTIGPTTPSIIYAIASFGRSGPPSSGILRSTDGGESWSRIQTGLPSGAQVYSLVIDPKDSSTIYLAVVFPAAEAGGILKSTDGGESWHAIDPGLPANTPIYALAIDPVTSSTMYMIADGTLFKSTNGGAKWNKAANGLTTIDVRALALNRVDATTVYAGAGDSVFQSVDSGASWSKLFAFQLFMSSTPPPFGAPPFPDGAPAYPLTLLIDFGDPNILYASTNRGNGCYFADNLLFKSTDGGASWSDRASPDKSGCVFGGFFGPSGGLKAMDPTDPNILYAAETDDEDGGYWLLKSQDAGATWKTIWDFTGNLLAGVWALVIDPTNPTTLYAGLDDVPMYSDSGPTPGLGGVLKSTDGGTSWDRIGLSGSAVNLLVMDPAHANVLYAATEGNYAAPRGFRGLYKSTDSGATWSAISNGLASLSGAGPGMTSLVIDPANSNILYAGTAGGGVFKSSDGGANWSPLNGGLGNFDVRVLAVAPGSQHTLYAGTSGGVFKIIDVAP